MPKPHSSPSLVILCQLLITDALHLSLLLAGQVLPHGSVHLDDSQRLGVAEHLHILEALEGIGKDVARGVLIRVAALGIDAVGLLHHQTGGTAVLVKIAEIRHDINHSAFGSSDGMDEMDERENYREMIMENIEYEVLVNRDNADRLDEIVEIMLDAVCSKNPTVRINGEDMSQQVVKSRFLKINSSHIEYVFETLQKNPSDIRNIRSYLLTTLYNASLTMDNYRLS